jgi:hypothetical protein
VLVALFALGFVAFNLVIASTLVIAAYGFDPTLLGARGALVERQLGTAGLLRWGAFVDLLGYLCFAAIVLYFVRAAAGVGARVAAFVGLSFALGGAIGASILGTAGAWLLESPISDQSSLLAVRVAFATVENIVIIGVWGTLGLFLLGCWLVWAGVSSRPVSRTFGYVGIVCGVGSLAYAVRTGITGATPVPFAGPFDVLIMLGVGLLPVWVLWFALRVWRGEPLTGRDHLAG